MAAGGSSGGIGRTGWIAGGFIAAAIGVGGLYFSGVLTPDPTPVPPVQAGLTAPDPPQEPITEPEPHSDTATATADFLVPRFDVVRVDPQGNTVIAGTGPPGARVTIYLDGSEQVSTVVDRGGAFVSLLTVAPSGTARVLSMIADLDGKQVPADDKIILAPTPSAEPEPDRQIALADTDAAVDSSPVATELPAPEAQAPATQAETASPEPRQPAMAQADQVIPANAPAQPAATDPPSGTPIATEAGSSETSQDSTKVVAEVKPESAAVSTSIAVDDGTEFTPETTPEVTPEATQASTAQALASNDPAPTRVTVLRAGKDGVEVLQPGTPVPKVLERIALDTISYSKDGEVQLSGRAQVHSVVRVYLDNEAMVDLATDQDGRWAGKVIGIAPGIYTLRLDELGRDGDVISRLETPFKRESPEVLRPILEPVQDPTVVAQGDTFNEKPAEKSPLIRAITVQRGDTLWAISREKYGEGVLYVRLFEANRADIRDPDLIFPGQVFTIPE